MLKTRKPTGAVPAPNILLAGEEGSGKTYAAFQLSASSHVRDTYVIDFGEGCADMYAELGPYQVVEHDGTLEGLAAVAKEIAALEQDPERPDVVVLDSVSTVWDAAKQWAENEARARDRRKGRNNAEPNITMDLWNAANRKFYRVIEPLLDWPGIVVLTARGRWVAAMDDNGRPIPGSKEWTQETQKRLPFAVDVLLRATNPRRLEVQKARTLRMQLPADRLLDITGVTLDSLIFEKLGVEVAEDRGTVRPDDRVPAADAKRELLDACGGDKECAKHFWGDRKTVTRLELDDLVESAAVEVAKNSPPAWLGEGWKADDTPVEKEVAA
jgi:hypothetical protein